jgi:hypothetical protein
MGLNLTDSSSRSLRRALRGNALFSAFCGAMILFAQPTVLSWLGLSGIDIRPVGAFLLLFAAYLVWMSRQQRLPRVLVAGVIAGDWAWVAGSVYLVALNPALFSTMGLLLVLDVAVVVMVFALLQARGLKKLAEETA